MQRKISKFRMFSTCRIRHLRYCGRRKKMIYCDERTWEAGIGSSLPEGQGRQTPMERSGYALARQVNLSLPVDELDKVLAARSAPAALLYLALQRTGGKLPRAEELSLSGADYQTAVEVLRGAGVLKTAEQPVPDLHTLPEYTAEDLVTRVNEDRGFSVVVHWAEQLYGRKLTSPEMKKLLGMQDHLGLPPAVLMQMLTYAFDAYREQHPTRRSPGIRYLEAEAIRWADDEVLTLDLAEQYIAEMKKYLGV